MPLINTIEQAKVYVGNLMHFNTITSLPNFTRTDARYLVPILGKTIYDNLVAQAEGTITDAELVRLAQQASAPLAYWHDAAGLQAKISDTGIHTFESENQRAAHRWEYEELKEKLQDDALWALDELLEYLFANKPLSWGPPTEIDTIIQTGNEFNSIFPLFRAHITFNTFRPLIKQVTDQYIISAIGQDFFTELKEATTLTADEAAVVLLIKKAVAHYTIKTAVDVLPVKIASQGFTVLLNSNTDKANQGEAAATANLLSNLKSTAGNNGDNYQVQLMSYLNSKASETVFTTFFNSEFYTNPTTTVEDPNTNRKGIVSFY